MEPVDSSPAAVLRCLATAGVAFEKFDHPAVFRVEDGLELLAHIPGQGSKNLFLRDKKGEQLFLVTVCEEKRVDLKALAEIFGHGRLSFASADHLLKHLCLEPGSVTPLGLLFDGQRLVRAYIDTDLLRAERIQIHPMTNTATIVLSGAELLDFFSSQGIVVTPLDVPVRLLE